MTDQTNGNTETEDRYQITRDGKPLGKPFTGTANECFAQLLRIQGQSVHYATTYSGYKIEPVKKDEE